MSNVLNLFSKKTKTTTYNEQVFNQINSTQELLELIENIPEADALTSEGKVVTDVDALKLAAYDTSNVVSVLTPKEVGWVNVLGIIVRLSNKLSDNIADSAPQSVFHIMYNALAATTPESINSRRIFSIS